MRISIAARNASILSAAAVMLTGCGGPPSSPTPSTSTQQRLTRSGSSARQGSLTRYYFLKLGTLGGSDNFASDINNRSQVGGASLLKKNEVEHAQLWADRSQRSTDLGTLGGPNSGIFEHNHGTLGQFVGWSEASKTDPHAEDYCGFGTTHICLAFSWRSGKMTSLPTLGGNNDEANDVNDRGQIVGDAETNTKDRNCIAPAVFDYRGVIWQPNGRIKTLPPYPGDTVSYAFSINQSGDAVGNSGSCASPLDRAILWRNGATIKLGSLGGTSVEADDINDLDQVVGFGFLAGDTAIHAFFWQSGTMSDLGTLPGDVDSFAYGLNDKAQIVGASCDASENCRGFIWQNGSMMDLNLLMAPNSSWDLYYGGDINDAGQIAGAAFNNQGFERAVVLLPRAKGEAMAAGAAPPQVAFPKSLRGRLWNARFGLSALGKSGIPR
jgi:probable HAF family extracellular repeat protein